jgi:phospholipid/cholesterol/gamma-HCH transport system substrate-binding protein
VDQVNAGQGTVGKLLKDETLYRETTESMTNLKEILQKVNQGKGSVGKLINDQEFYKNAKLTLQKLDQATEGLEDQGPLSVLGLAVSKLF